jgi:anti-anti-sigma factor
VLDDVMRVDVSHTEGVCVLRLHGDIDADSILTLQVVFDEIGLQDSVVLDMEQVRFMDSSGLNVLVRQSLLMSEVSSSLRIRNASDGVRLVVETTGLGDFFYESPLPEG